MLGRFAVSDDCPCVLAPPTLKAILKNREDSAARMQSVRKPDSRKEAALPAAVNDAPAFLTKKLGHALGLAMGGIYFAVHCIHFLCAVLTDEGFGYEVGFLFGLLVLISGQNTLLVRLDFT